MPAQVDFAEPQRADSHLSGAWKESLIKDAGKILISSASCQIFLFHFTIVSLGCLKEDCSKMQKAG